MLLGIGAEAIHLCVTHGLHRIPTSEFGISNRIVAGGIDAEILVSGSSRALRHYDPRIVQQLTGLKTFNIGRNGSQTDMQLALLRTYLRHNTKPRLVIHNLDLFSFLTTHEVYDPAQYVPYTGEPDIYQTLSRFNPSVWKWRYIPLYGYLVEDMRFTWIKGLSAALGVYPKEDHFQGFQPYDLEWTGDFEHFKAKHAEGVRVDIEPQGVNDLETLLLLCNREGIPVLLVYSPVYFEMQALEKNRDELFGKFRETSLRYHCLLWDYSSSPICQEREFFYNSQHLNAKGADRFSTDLARRLVRERPWGNLLLSENTSN